MFDLTKRPTRHSYSSISKYKECPAAYGYGYIQRLPNPPTSAMMRGTRLHKLAEDYMNASEEVPVPFDIRKIGLKLYQLRSQGAKPEAVWCVNRNWEPCSEDDPDGWIKAVIDVHLLDNDVLKLHDYKSGREYPTHADQLELYSSIGLAWVRDAKRAESSAIYFDTGHEGSQRSIIRDLLPHIRARTSADIGRMESDNEFRPRPGGHCERCAFASKAGGPCEAWRNRE